MSTGSRKTSFYKGYLPKVLFLRVLLALWPSYVHPDEYFQSQEITAKLVFGLSTYVPWEFQTESALRTILTPLCTTGIPYFCLKFLRVPISGQILLTLPRLILAVVSCTMDLVAFNICTKFQIEFHDGVGKLLASSWAILVFFSRPFSNTVEALVLVYSLGVYFLWENGRTKRIILGGLLAIGVFSRFTFIAFFLPIGTFLLLDALPSKRESKGVPRFNTMQLFVVALSECMLGSVVTTAVFIYSDWLYYGRLVVTPLNNFIYNMNSANLALHGLHPRWLHVVVNIPMLCGPFGYYVLYLMYTKVLRWSSFYKSRRNVWSTFTEKMCRWWQNTGSSSGKARDRLFVEQVELLCILCVCSGLLVLSLAPHQEPRFLLPVVFPICLIAGRHLGHRKHGNPRLIDRLYILWIVTNFVLCMLFGVLHQGGVLRSILAIQESRPFSVIYFHTHMPPRFLLLNAVQREGWGKKPTILLEDLGGSSVDTLQNKLKFHLKRRNEEDLSGKGRPVWLVAPASLDVSAAIFSVKSFVQEHKGKEKGTVSPTNQIWPHLSMEDLPRTFGELCLNVYTL